MAYQQNQQQYQYDPNVQQQQPHGYQPQQGMQVAPQPKTGEWNASLMNCSPCDSCMLACCLPCLILGKTSERLRDPSLQSYEAFNTDCLLMCGITYLIGCPCVYIMIKRGEIRERYGIKGSGFGDCCTSFWCGCCALIQQDNEVKGRESQRVTAQGYQQQQGMQYPGPAQPGKH